jgi:hypothetical protein
MLPLLVCIASFVLISSRRILMKTKKENNENFNNFMSAPNYYLKHHN